MEAEIQELKLKLKESESKQVAIAQLAKEILEKDKDKDQRLSTLGQENLQQSRDICRLQALLKSRDEYLADAESEVVKLRNEITAIKQTKSAYLVELEQKLSSLRAEINEKSDILFEQEHEIQELKKTLESKERELKKASQEPETLVGQICDAFPDSDREKLNGKMAEMELERNLMLDEISQLQDKIVVVNRNLDNERNHVQELSTICSGYRHDVEELKNRCNELTSELNEYHSKTKVAKRGNSMFFEFVDERVKLEKDLLKLKCENDFFVSQKEAYELELNELRHELMLALTLRTDEGNVGSDTSMLQLEISRLRTELIALNAKLLEKCEKSMEVETGAVSNTSELVDMKEYAFNSLKKEVKILTVKLDRAQKERMEYFDKVRESENRYSEECRRSRKLLNEVECLKRRLVLEQKKSFNNALSKTLKPSKEILSEKITVFNEKIANINQIDADDPPISEIQSSFTLPNCSLTSGRHPLKEGEIANGMGTVPVESTSDTDQNEAPHLLSELKTQSNTNDKEMPVEKRLKFQLPDEEFSQSATDRANAAPRKSKPRRIIRRVCEAGGL